MRRFDGRTAFITGAAHGIGRATAHRLAAEGARVVIADHDHDAARRTADELGDTATAVDCDVRDRESVDAAVTTATDTLGGIDVLVNNVGIAGNTPLPDLDDTEWDRQVDPTLTGAIRCIQACLPHLLAAPGGGAIVSISSVNGIAACGSLPYSTAKAGIIAATQNLAVTYGRRAQNALDADHGWLRCNAIAPGTVRTRAWTSTDAQAANLDKIVTLYPAGRVGEPDDIAAAVAFLASADADWITGVTLPVDGGLLAGPLTSFGNIGME